MACGILVLLIAAIAASTNGYGSKDYYSGDKEDYSYKPKVVKSSSYSSSSYVSHGHHAGYAGHKLITGYSSGGFGAGYRSGHGGIVYDYGYYKSHHGFSIHHNRFSYGGIDYGRLCSSTKLYGALNSCYEDYGDIGDCFPGLIKQEDYSEIGYSSGPIYDRSYYYSHHGFRIRHHRFSYNGIGYDEEDGYEPAVKEKVKKKNNHQQSNQGTLTTCEVLYPNLADFKLG
ncbi:unnamed protein product [Mytilus edulis]|uniref:Uncharacterized protein n=1 Tax=Mytilus edulis TaxID=6550 RepID=A0A8S3SRC1_MYTED|nr:unnamed protein product [Mytilus edulis]